MNSINNNASTQMQSVNDTKRSSKMETMAKSMGVPDEVIVKGKSAVKTWMKENGKMPGSIKKEDENKIGKSSTNLTEQLNASGISHESFVKALEEGPESTKKLFDENDFSFNVIA